MKLSKEEWSVFIKLDPFQRWCWMVRNHPFDFMTLVAGWLCVVYVSVKILEGGS